MKPSFLPSLFALALAACGAPSLAEERRSGNSPSVRSRWNAAASSAASAVARWHWTA
jgi:hypothetical protein